jgi:hypothetical protein
MIGKEGRRMFISSVSDCTVCETIVFYRRCSRSKKYLCYQSFFNPPTDAQLALTSPTGGGRSVGIVPSRTKAMEFSFLTDAQLDCLETILKFTLKLTLKQLQHISV